jgi:hypothetical protein
MPVKNINDKNGTFWKVVLVMAGALLTVGGLCATIRFNSERITKVETLSIENKGDIRELKTDIKYIKGGVDDIKEELRK